MMKSFAHRSKANPSIRNKHVSRKSPALMAATAVSLTLLYSQVSHGATVTWDAGGGTSEIGTAANWTTDVIPSIVTPDVGVFDGTVAGPLALTHSTTSFAGGPGNVGIALSFTGTQTSAVSLDSGANTSALRLGGPVTGTTQAAITIAAGAGAFTLGDGVGTFNITLGGVAGTTQQFINNSSNVATINSDVVLGLGGGGVHTLTFTGTGNWVSNNAFISAATENVQKLGSGTMYINGNSSTWVNTLSAGAGKLVIGSDLGSAPGVGSVGGNTAGTGIILNSNPASGTSAYLNINTTGTVRTGSGNSTIGSVSGGTGILNMAAGTLVTGGAAAQRDLQAGNAGFGTINITGGTTTIGGFLVAGIGTAGAHGIWNISAPVSVVGNFAGTLGASANTTGVVNITSGGSYSSVGATAGTGLFVGEAGVGILNVSGTGTVATGGIATSIGLDLGRNNVATSSGIANLGAVGVGGGTITTNIVRHSGAAATGIFNFHGGTLKASAAPSATFMTGLSAAYVYGEGATIDNSGQNITIGQSLLAPVGTGVTVISPAASGLVTTGYTTAPLVTISGGTGTGATAVATIDASGNLTGITVTNPGVYSVAPTTVTLAGGGYAAASTSTTALTTASNAVNGSVTYKGTGVTTITGASTYTGTTAIDGNGNGGTLNLSGGSLNGPVDATAFTTQVITFKASGAATIGGNGSLNLNSISLPNTAVYSSVDSTINTLTINNANAGANALTLSGGVTLNFEAGATAADSIVLGAGLKAAVLNTNTVNVTLLARPSASQDVTLISAPGGGISLANFTLGTVSGGASLFGLSNTLISPNGTLLQLHQVASPSPTTAYFVGDLGTSISANDGSFANFSTNAAGTVKATQLPGATTDVHYYAANANTGNAAASTLDGSITFKTLTFEGASAAAIAQGTAGTLTIAPASASTGITVTGSSGGATISAPVALGASQTWTNDSVFTVSGAITNGASNLTVAGAGITTISGAISNGTGSFTKTGSGSLSLNAANLYSGGTTVNGGTVNLGVAAALPAASSLTLSGGTVEMNGFAQTVGTLSDGGSSAGTLINSGATNIGFTTSSTATSSYSGQISGSINFNKAGSGTLTLSGSNSYFGSTTISGGTLIQANPSAFGVLLSTTTVTPTNGTTWVIATDGGDTAYPSNFGTGTTYSLVLDRATPGAAFDRTLGTASYGGGQVNITQGANVTSGTPTLTFNGGVILTAGFSVSTTFAPVGVNVVLPSVAGVANQGQLHTIGLAGTTTANLVTGPITNGGGTTAVLKTDTGMWTLTGASTYTGATTVNGGTLLLDTTGTLGGGASALSVGAGGKLKLATTLNAVPSVGSITIAGTTVAPTGTIDLTNKGIVINYTGAVGTILTDALARVKAGKGTANANGVFAYDGFGITSSSIAADNALVGFNKFAIGAINNADLVTFGLTAYTTFGGLATVDADSILARYTYNGDANLDGKIDAADYDLINRGFAGTIANVGWLSGDFTSDGLINADDYAVIDFGFLKQGGQLGLGDPVSVPEPTSIGLISLAAATLLKRRRRQA